MPPPSPPQQRWVRIEGDGPAYSGPCLLTHILFKPDANHDYVDIYDGRDATTGKKFCRLSTANRTIGHINLHPGIRFDLGIYVDGYDAAVETTVVFIPQDVSPL